MGIKDNLQNTAKDNADEIKKYSFHRYSKTPIIQESKISITDETVCIYYL